VSVRQVISGTTRAIFTKFLVHVAYGRSSSGRVTKSQGEGAILGGFSSPLTMHCNAFAANNVSRTDHYVAAAFAANGIGREEDDGSAHRGRSVISTIALLHFA